MLVSITVKDTANTARRDYMVEEAGVLPEGLTAAIVIAGEG